MRAVRWRFLLAPVVRVPYRSAFAYLNIGYFANTFLPARLGDGARAFLAGRSFGISSLAALGLIVVERVADTIVILIAVLAAGALVAGGSQVAGGAMVIAAAAVLGMAVLGLLAIAAIRSGLLRPLPPPDRPLDPSSSGWPKAGAPCARAAASSS